MSSMLPSVVLRLRFLLFDVDGVLTDGRLYYLGDEVAVAFDTRDGLAVRRAREAGLGIGLLSARSDSPAVERRAADLGFDEVLLGCRDKAAAFADLLERRGLEAFEVAYVGDDLVDLPVLRAAGLSAAPADAVEEVRDNVDLVLDAPGGRGAARELVDRIIDALGPVS